jgi:hypothetical protein
MNVRKIVARLNAQTIRFGIGRGGIPELTNQDIAAAIGMIQDEFARDVFVAIWWPDGAKLDHKTLIRHLYLAQRAIIDKQMKTEQIARLELHIAQENYAAKKFRTHEDGIELDRLERNIDRLRLLHWPLKPAMYPVLREAVLSEMKSPNQCECCGGRGILRTNEKLTVCEECSGSGVIPVTSAKRAKAIGVSRSCYAHTWRKVYEWTYSLLAEKEQAAATELAYRLS